MTATDPRPIDGGSDSQAPAPAGLDAVTAQRLERVARARGFALRDRHMWRLPAALAVLDLVTAVTAGLLMGLPVLVLVVLAVAVVAALGARGMYVHRLSLSALDDLPAVLGSALLAAATAVTAVAITGEAAAVSPIALAALAWATVTAVLHGGVYHLVRQRRRRRGEGVRTLIIGAGLVGTRIGQALFDHPEYGLRPVGYLDEQAAPDLSPLGPPVLGRVIDLPVIAAATGAQAVVVAFSWLQETDLVDVLRGCDRLDCEIFVVPRLFELNQSRGRLDHVWGVPLVRLRRPAFRSRSWVLKRGMDIVGASVGLVLAAPLLVVAGLALRRETRAGLLFRQERVGLDGRPFSLIKLQTLVPVDEAESQTKWNIGADERVGPVGRFLRRSSIDELPQLWNVLRGDMSLVGPRPERPYFAANFTRHLARYGDRHRVPVGMTGWAQVHGLRGNTSIEERASFDNFYIEQWSLWADVKIVLRTIPAALRRSGS